MLKCLLARTLQRNPTSPDLPFACTNRNPALMAMLNAFLSNLRLLIAAIDEDPLIENRPLLLLICDLLPAFKPAAVKLTALAAHRPSTNYKPELFKILLAINRHEAVTLVGPF